jgi:hypothetical protein
MQESGLPKKKRKNEIRRNERTTGSEKKPEVKDKIKKL